jgi:DNA-binding NarL/FixJ family response regulator
MTAERWRVAVLEDDTDTRKFFEACIAMHPLLGLAASFATLASARAWFEDNTVDVFLTDLSLPDGHGLTLITELAQHQPTCEILVVSVFGDEDSVLSCVQAGAVGYIHKDSRPADVAQIIIDIMHGASPISPMIARKLLERLRHAAPGAAPAPTSASASHWTPPAPAPSAAVLPLKAGLPLGQDVVLTPREVDVLELVARGYAYAEIARVHSMSIHTVQSHIKHLYAKLAVHSRSEAVFEASRLGLLRSMKAGDA